MTNNRLKNLRRQIKKLIKRNQKRRAFLQMTRNINLKLIAIDVQNKDNKDKIIIKMGSKFVKITKIVLKDHN